MNKLIIDFCRRLQAAAWCLAGRPVIYRVRKSAGAKLTIDLTMKADPPMLMSDCEGATVNLIEPPITGAFGGTFYGDDD